jgi:rhamnosyltransferase
MTIPAATVLYRADPELLDKLLSALCLPGRRVYIYANGPTSTAVDGILDTFENLHLIRSAENGGHAVGLNAIMDIAFQDGATHIVLFDQDSTPDLDLVDNLWSAFEICAIERDALAAVGPLLVSPAGEDYLPIRYEWRGTQKDDSFRDAYFLPTSGTLISIAAWQDIGRFREDYFIGGIDVEWGLRAWDRGYQSVVATRLPLVHRWGVEGRGTSGARHQFLRQPAHRLYLYIRNSVHKLTLSHVPLGWKASHSARLVAQVALAGLARHRHGVSVAILARAIKDGWRGRLGPPPENLVASIPASISARANYRLTTCNYWRLYDASSPPMPPKDGQAISILCKTTCSMSALSVREGIEAAPFQPTITQACACHSAPRPDGGHHQH